MPCFVPSSFKNTLSTLLLLLGILMSFTSCEDDSMDPNLFITSLGKTQQFSEIDKNSFVVLDNGDIVTAINAFSPDDPANTSVEALGINVLKMDAKGEKIWEKYYTGGKVKRCSDLIQTQDGGFLITGAQSEGEDYYNYTAIYLMKVNADGDLLWEKSYDLGSNGVGMELAEKSNGEIVLFGRTGSPKTFYLDSNGDILEEFFPVGGGRTMLLTSDEKTLIASSKITLFEGTQKLWQFEFSNSDANSEKVVNDIIETPEGDFVGFGYILNYIDNSSNYLVVKISSDGQLIWERIYEEPQNNFAEEIIQTPDGNFITLGVNESSNQSSLRLRTIDSNGEELSIRVIEFSNESVVIASDLQMIGEQYLGVLGAGFNIAGTSSSITQYYKQFKIQE